MNPPPMIPPTITPPMIIPAVRYQASGPPIISTPDIDARNALMCLMDAWEMMMGPTSADPDGQAYLQFTAHHRIIHQALAQYFAGQP